VRSARGRNQLAIKVRSQPFKTDTRPSAETLQFGFGFERPSVQVMVATRELLQRWYATPGLSSCLAVRRLTATASLLSNVPKFNSYVVFCL